MNELSAPDIIFLVLFWGFVIYAVARKIFGR